MRDYKLAIIDIDGTLADNSHRAHLVDCEAPDWEAFLRPELVAQDTLQPHARAVIENLVDAGFDLVFLTGRNGGLREVTTKWLIDHLGLSADGVALIMRPRGDNQLPTTFKAPWVEKLLKDRRPSVAMSFDDDPYMQPIYLKHGCIPFLAPECWASMFTSVPDLPPELAWRK